VWLNGELLPRDAATVSIDDFGFLYGAACFETMRAFGGVVFRLDRHLARLNAGLDALGVTPPLASELAAVIDKTLEANSLRDARVRLTVSAGRGGGRPDLSSSTAPTVLVVAEPAPPDPGPAVLAIASQRVDRSRPLPRAKTANYLASIVALAEARHAGADDALLLHPDGDIVEAATANVFLITSGRLLTPPLAAGPLPGVTREAVLECARSLGLHAEERSLTPPQLGTVEEMLLTNSVVGVRAVSSVVDRWTGTHVPGPVTARLADAYCELVRAECGPQAQPATG
jgi:branched-chain amino acid aminotransferase